MGGTNRQEWRRTQELLLGAELISGVWEFALGGRRSLALDFAGPVGVDHWRTVAERVLRRNAAESAEVKVTPDGVTTAGPRDIAEVEAQITGVQRLIGRIARYEARFRADGLLAEGKFVRSVEAWDYGRASAMARFGLGARYCAVQEAEQAVLHASRVARTAYRSPAAVGASAGRGPGRVRTAAAPGGADAGDLALSVRAAWLGPLTALGDAVMTRCPLRGPPARTGSHRGALCGTRQVVSPTHLCRTGQ
ncbi:DUF1266 domain-containing protein [Streptomyces sp. NPDC005355]|uniref:DUF1266 domain-containing protein n=1 Tax=Streptomyces sp. NPDC005355 TaxID=3157038 RepID=UPI0033AD771A